MILKFQLILSFECGSNYNSDKIINTDILQNKIILNKCNTTLLRFFFNSNHDVKLIPHFPVLAFSYPENLVPRFPVVSVLH